MAKFIIAYKKTQKIEGNYSNDKDDPGGETYKGISRRNWPGWHGWDIIDNYFRVFSNNPSEINAALAKIPSLQLLVQHFYKENYWDKANLTGLPQLIANEIFDTGVNQALIKSVRFFQKSLNMLNYDQKYYPDIIEDGQLGKQTLKSFTGYMRTAKIPGRNRQRNITTILKLMNGLQLFRYVSVVRENKKMEKYMYGWINRN